MQKEKSIGRNILIVVLILVTIASVCAGLFAWAKYQTTINGTATGETAKWNFKVSDGNTSTQEIEFPMTRTDNNESVAEGKIAPGTYGELQIGIDATGTETALTYVIEGTIENLPTNLKFYSDAERTLELTVLDNKFSKGGYMKLNEVGSRAEKIYWEWTFETTTNPVITEEKLTSLGIDKTEYNALITAKKFVQANDMLDTAESDKQVSMTVSVTGKQLNGNPVLADLVQVGDYVNYDASSNGVKTFTSEDAFFKKLNEDTENTTGNISISATISTDEAFNSSEKAQWRVLSVDKNAGTVELISVAPTSQTITIGGGKGFVYAEDALNTIGSIYGEGKGAISGRSIELEDVEKYSSFNKKNGTEKTFTSGKFYKQVVENGNVIGYETKLTQATSEAPLTMIKTLYEYTPKNYFTNKTIYSTLFCETKPKFWFASRSATHYTSSGSPCDFGVFFVNGEDLLAADYNLYNSAGGTKSHPGRCVPVVSLEPNIQITGQVNGVWQLDV